MFRALSDIVTDPRGGRRPCSVAEIAAVAEVSVEEVARAVELFRRPGRSFLMPPDPVPLTAGTIVDLAHESLMRCWTRLRGWVEEERSAANVYLRLTRAAQWFEDGTAGLWRDPELGLGLKWRAERRPTAAWAERYDPSFDRAMRFLEDSERERDRLVNERRVERRRQWRRLQWVAAALALLLFLSGVNGYVATRQSARARAESARAERNLQLARAAVDESLLVVEREPSRLGVDVPEIVGFRRELLEKAQRFYLDFIKQAPQSEDLQRELAVAQLRLGHIDRALDAPERAVADYQAAVKAFATLSQTYPGRPDYRRAMAEAQSWLGEALRLAGGRYTEAKAAYDTALEMASGPVAATELAAQQQALARVRYNRGILLADHAGQNGATIADAEADLREAIRLLESLPAQDPPLGAQDLGRAYNNLGSVVALDDGRIAEVRDLYTRAVQIHEDLTRREPANREYAMELVKFYNNLSATLRDNAEPQEAARRNGQARERIELLARPAPSVGIERADSYNLRGWITEEGLPGDVGCGLPSLSGSVCGAGARRQHVAVPGVSRAVRRPARESGQRHDTSLDDAARRRARPVCGRRRACRIGRDGGRSRLCARHDGPRAGGASRPPCCHVRWCARPAAHLAHRSHHVYRRPAARRRFRRPRAETRPITTGRDSHMTRWSFASLCAVALAAAVPASAQQLAPAGDCSASRRSSRPRPSPTYAPSHAVGAERLASATHAAAPPAPRQHGRLRRGRDRRVESADSFRCGRR